MRPLALLALAGTLMLTAAGALRYPSAPRGDVVDTYFGTNVPDPYRWMENVDSPDVKSWVQSENALSRSYLDAVPERVAICDRYRALLNREYFSVPVRVGKRWFYAHNTGLQNQSVWYVGKSEHDRGHVFLDPNAFSRDGTVSLTSTAFTRNGKYLAYATESAVPIGRRGTCVTSQAVAIFPTFCDGANLPERPGAGTTAFTTRAIPRLRTGSFSHRSPMSVCSIIRSGRPKARTPWCIRDPIILIGIFPPISHAIIVGSWSTKQVAGSGCLFATCMHREVRFGDFSKTIPKRRIPSSTTTGIVFTSRLTQTPRAGA